MSIYNNILKVDLTLFINKSFLMQRYHRPISVVDFILQIHDEFYPSGMDL